MQRFQGHNTVLVRLQHAPDSALAACTCRLALQPLHGNESTIKEGEAAPGSSSAWLPRLLREEAPPKGSALARASRSSAKKPSRTASRFETRRCSSCQRCTADSLSDALNLSGLCLILEKQLACAGTSNLQPGCMRLQDILRDRPDLQAKISREKKNEFHGIGQAKAAHLAAPLQPITGEGLQLERAAAARHACPEGRPVRGVPSVAAKGSPPIQHLPQLHRQIWRVLSDCRAARQCLQQGQTQAIKCVPCACTHSNDEFKGELRCGDWKQHSNITSQNTASGSPRHH